MTSQIKDLIYDWNRIGLEEDPRTRRAVTFDDETLRDGLQSPSVRNPAIGEKLEILHLMEELGIEAVDLGLPGTGFHVMEEVTRLAQEISRCNMKLLPNCAARTVKSDIQPIIEISQKAGIPIEACTFIGSSTIRQHAEDWSLETMLRAAEEAVQFAVGNGLPVMFVTEDTTRTRPETLVKLYGCALDNGATALTICDSVGHATPHGVRQLIHFVREKIVAPRKTETRIDYHGHMDRGLGLANAVAAAEAGADQLHACALGLGERVGNTPMDLLLVNMQLMGYSRKNLSRLDEYCRAVSLACDVPIPSNYPVVGSDAFRTGTGVHAVAIIKALRKGDVELANLVYSGVPSHWFGFEQVIEVGPMSGRSNVIHWLERHRIEPEEGLIKTIFDAAKASDHVLTDTELRALVDLYRRAP